MFRMCNRLLIVLVGIIPAVRSVLWVGSGQKSGGCGSHAQVSQRQRRRQIERPVFRFKVAKREFGV